MNDREARLAAALRENLRRRKAQARARAAGPAGPAAAEPADGRNLPEGSNPPRETDEPPKDR
ncbi:hypothetical protein ACI6QG_04130 [Roseococcus sp. DSY-14]|uniref:hypothetical protein n=1 Tax=Roseococcus sp. DSY-14 TaxID=3369650 RepID=UPI00387B4B77